MLKIHFGQKTIQHMFNFKKQKTLMVSNNYVTNGYVLFTQDAVKNHTELITTNDRTNWFFIKGKLITIGKLPVKDSIQTLTDDSINQALTPQGEIISHRKMKIQKTGLTIDTDDFQIQVWACFETSEVIFFNDEIMKYYKINDTILYGWNPDRIFMDTLNGNFKIGVMPSKADVFEGEKRVEVIGSLQKVIAAISSVPAETLA